MQKGTAHGELRLDAKPCRQHFVWVLLSQVRINEHRKA